MEPNNSIVCCPRGCACLNGTAIPKEAYPLTQIRRSTGRSLLECELPEIVKRAGVTCATEEVDVPAMDDRIMAGATDRGFAPDLDWSPGERIAVVGARPDVCRITGFGRAADQNDALAGTVVDERWVGAGCWAGWRGQLGPDLVTWGIPPKVALRARPEPGGTAAIEQHCLGRRIPDLFVQAAVEWPHAITCRRYIS